jgi:septal ring factor EnvC (AmiA/AmiB activator)
MFASATTDKVYISPTKKLVRFFETSRDDWKAKCRTAKVRLKRHKQRVRRLEQSRDQWKQRVTDLEAEVARLKAREHALEQTVAALKNGEPAASGSWAPAGWGVVAYRHTYPSGAWRCFWVW